MMVLVLGVTGLRPSMLYCWLSPNSSRLRSKITLCRMVDRMEEAGMLERRRDPADRRAWQVHLTDRSRPMIEGLRGCVEQLNDDMQAGLTAEQRSVLASALEQVRMNLGGNPAPAYRTSVNG